MQLVPYNDRNDDLLLSRFKDLGPKQVYITTLPRPSAYPSPIEDSLSILEFIDDTTHHIVTHAIQVLYNAHMDACDLKQTFTIDHNEAGLHTFNYTHSYHHERCEIFSTHYYDTYNAYIHEHMPFAADIRAIISLSMSLSKQTYIDPPTHPLIPNYLSEYEEILREILDTRWDDFIYSQTEEINAAFDTEFTTTHASSSSKSNESQASKTHFYSEDTFLPIVFILLTFTRRASVIISESRYTTDTYALFNLLSQLHYDVSNTFYVHDNRKKINRPLPDGWIEPLVVRTATRTTQLHEPDIPLSDNNDNSSSQVNVLDVRSTPSTYTTSLCFLFILSAGT